MIIRDDIVAFKYNEKRYTGQILSINETEKDADILTEEPEERLYKHIPLEDIEEFY